MKPKLVPAFSAISVPRLLVLFVMAFVATAVMDTLVWTWLLTSEETLLWDAVLGVLLYVFLAGFLWAASHKAGVLSQISLGPRSRGRDLRDHIALGIPLVGVSVFCIYVLYLPLSYIYPEFVEYILLEDYEIFFWRTDAEAVAASIINAVVLVFFAPVIEELFFRGFMLNRLLLRYGSMKATIFSSILFSLLHVDFIGALLFGFTVSHIYLKTKSLIASIIVHISNNCVVVMIVVIDGVVSGETSSATLDEFQAAWWLAAVGAAIGIPWLVWFFKKLGRQAFDAV